METIAIFADDAVHAEQMLRPMLNQTRTRWVVVGCAPKLTPRIGRYASHSSRDQWRTKWCAKLFDAMAPLFAGQPAEQVETIIAKGPLPEVVHGLRQRYGSELRVLDARRPKLGVVTETLGEAQPREDSSRWAVPIAVSSGLSMVLALSD